MRRPRPPCGAGCPRRSTVCHDPKICPAWGAYQTALAEYKAILAAGRRAVDDYEKVRNGRDDREMLKKRWR